MYPSTIFSGFNDARRADTAHDLAVLSSRDDAIIYAAGSAMFAAAVADMAGATVIDIFASTRQMRAVFQTDDASAQRSSIKRLVARARRRGAKTGGNIVYHGPGLAQLGAAMSGGRGPSFGALSGHHDVDATDRHRAMAALNIVANELDSGGEVAIARVLERDVPEWREGMDAADAYRAHEHYAALQGTVLPPRWYKQCGPDGTTFGAAAVAYSPADVWAAAGAA